MSMDGEWFMYPVDEGMPETLDVYKGPVDRRVLVRRISRAQALAFARYYGHKGLHYQYQDRVDHWQSVRVVGDIEEWYGDHETINDHINAIQQRKDTSKP